MTFDGLFLTIQDSPFFKLTQCIYPFSHIFKTNTPPCGKVIPSRNREKRHLLYHVEEESHKKKGGVLNFNNVTKGHSKIYELTSRGN